MKSNNYFIIYFTFPLFYVLVKDMINNKGSVRQKLEEILKLMLMLWCRQSQISRLVAPEPCGKNILFQTNKINTRNNINNVFLILSIAIKICDAFVC